MKRYLNKVREIPVIVSSGYKYAVSGTPSPALSDNEIFIGTVSSSPVGLFIKKSNGIYAISFDDFSYGFLNDELDDITAKITTILGSVSEANIPTVPDEDGVS
jgi:hypothetical protein